MQQPSRPAVGEEMAPPRVGVVFVSKVFAFPRSFQTLSASHSSQQYMDCRATRGPNVISRPVWRDPSIFFRARLGLISPGMMGTVLETS